MAQCASLGKKTAWFMAVSPYRGAYMPKKVGTCYVCNNRSPTLWRNNAYYDTFRGTTVVPTRPCNACPAGKATKAGATAAVPGLPGRLRLRRAQEGFVLDAEGRPGQLQLLQDLRGWLPVRERHHRDVQGVPQGCGRQRQRRGPQDQGQPAVQPR